MNTLSEETDYIASYQDTLLIIIDGGDTPGLTFDIHTSFPDEALLLRQELLDNSPYLSDTVMKSAIYKDDVLPNAMIRDILTANPQSAKSGDILEAVDNRIEPMPSYMLTEILQGQNVYGAKEILEQKFGSHIAKKEKAWTNINLYYKNDTANYGQAFDSLIVLYQNENKLAARYDLAFLYLDKADSVNAFSILTAIPDEFDINEQELLTKDQYTDLFDILWDMKNDTIGLDSIQIQTLLEMSSVSNSLPGIFASNLLIKEGVLIYNEPVYLGEEFVKSVDAQAKKTDIENEKSNLKLFPNPAGNYFIAQYDLRKEEFRGIITISDINGKELRALQLKDKQNQIIIPALEFTNGIYLIKLQSGNEILDAEKISINR